MENKGVALLAAAVMAAVGFLYGGGGRLGIAGGARLALKGSATLVAAALACYGALHGGGTPAWLICAGIAVCAAADVLLERVFFAGMACFAAGHALYIAAFLMMRPVGAASAAAFAALAVVCCAVAYALRARLTPAAAYLLYGLLLSAMAALAVGQRPSAWAGAWLFLASDLVLAFRLAGAAPAAAGHAVLLLYYGGQYLLALSTLVR